SVYDQEFEGCVRTLMAVAPEESRTLDAICELVRCYRDWSSRGNHPGDTDARRVVYFLEQLAALGPKAKRATPILADLKFDENGNIRKAADRALKQIGQD